MFYSLIYSLRGNIPFSSCGSSDCSLSASQLRHLLIARFHRRYFRSRTRERTKINNIIHIIRAQYIHEQHYGWHTCWIQICRKAASTLTRNCPNAKLSWPHRQQALHRDTMAMKCVVFQRLCHKDRLATATRKVFR